MTTNWLPTGNKILVRVTPVEKKTASGIIIHETTTERQEMSQMDGTIVALGPLAYKDQGTDWVKVGDQVKFSKFAGYLHEENGVKYRVMHDLDVIMVLAKGDGE